MINNLPQKRPLKFSVIDGGRLSVALAVITVGIGLGFAFSSSYKENLPPTDAERTDLSPAQNLALEAKAAVIFDVAAGKLLYAKNANIQLPLASLTKLMTALSAEAQADLKTPITVSLLALKEEGDTGLRAGERWQLKDLVDHMLVASSNDAAAAIALALEKETAENTKKKGRSFVAFMNTYAKELGLTETYFLNPTGLDESKELAGAYGSAFDIANLMAFTTTRHPELLRATQEERVMRNTLDKETLGAINTNFSTGTLTLLRGGKTGLTDLAGGNLVVTFDVAPNHPMVAVVLGSSERGRFQDIQKLVEATLSTYQLSEK